MIPSRRLIRLLLVWVAVSFFVALVPAWIELWWGLFALLACVVIADGVYARVWGDIPDVERQIAGNLPVGVWREVALRFVHRGRRVLRITAFDGLPPGADFGGMPLALTLQPGEFAVARYPFRAEVRGDLRFERVALRVQSVLGLWEIARQAGHPGVVRSLPNFAEITRYALLAIDNRLSQIGVLKKRRRGEGMDFLQLREYRQGDTMRQIDWKATSRMRKLISREYQDERDQQIVFLIDCGRRMSARDGELSHFDHTLNAVLLLTYVALREGDSASLMTFATDQAKFIAPRKSGDTVNHFLNALYSLQPSLQTPDYYRAAIDLSLRLKKRSLIVLVSNLRDEDAEGLLPALQLLRRRHLVMFANLREGVIDDILKRPVKGADDAFTYAATAGYLQDRDAVTRRIRSGGARLLDIEPAALPVALVNRYLDLKQSGAL
jgi:uncharacterized protein (DUF58 family)